MKHVQHYAQLNYLYLLILLSINDKFLKSYHFRILKNIKYFHNFVKDGYASCFMFLFIFARCPGSYKTNSFTKNSLFKIDKINMMLKFLYKIQSKTKNLQSPSICNNVSVYNYRNPPKGIYMEKLELERLVFLFEWICVEWVCNMIPFISSE